MRANNPPLKTSNERRHSESRRRSSTLYCSRDLAGDGYNLITSLTFPSLIVTSPPSAHFVPGFKSLLLKVASTGYSGSQVLANQGLVLAQGHKFQLHRAPSRLFSVSSVQPPRRGSGVIVLTKPNFGILHNKCEREQNLYTSVLLYELMSDPNPVSGDAITRNSQCLYPQSGLIRFPPSFRC
ncbi:hypothetical protein J6590_038900 [Homalodisca vitripennis]|nr:hypothetical protein J6590_038900 [Homalodisca vitripennis]